MASFPVAFERLTDERRVAAERLNHLCADFAAVVAASVDSNADDEHDPDGATIAFERAQLSALIGQARQHLAEIGAALGRIEADSYGACESCGGDIAPARLDARPSARTCIACADRARTE